MDDTCWRGHSSGDCLQFDFVRPGPWKTKRTTNAQAAIRSAIEAIDHETNSEVPGWLRLARQLPEALRADLVAELRAGNPIVGIGTMGWPSKGSIVVTMGERFTAARRLPPAGVVWCAHNNEPHSWREDLSQQVGPVVFILMT